MEEKRVKIRLCRFTESFYPYPGGISVHVTQLSKKINSHVEKQIILTPLLSPLPLNNKSFDFEVKYIKHSIKRGRLLKSLLYFFTDLPLLIKTIKRENITLIHAHSWRPGIVATVAGRLTSTPVAWTVHGMGPHRLRQDINPEMIMDKHRRRCLFHSLLYFMECANTRQKLRLLFLTVPLIKLFQPDRIFAVQDGTSTDVLMSLITKREKVVRVYHGISIPDKEYLLELRGRAKKNIDRRLDKSFILITTSRFVMDKGLEYAIQTLWTLRERYQMQNAVLIMIGHGRMEGKLRAMAKSYGLAKSVIFTGALSKSEVEEYLSIADVYLGTGIYGNRNNATMEAMAYGVPAVIFYNRWDEYPEGTVISVSARDYEAMAEAVHSLYVNDDKRKRIVFSAISLLKKQNSWENRIKTEIDEYLDLLEEKKGQK